MNTCITLRYFYKVLSRIRNFIRNLNKTFYIFSQVIIILSGLSSALSSIGKFLREKYYIQTLQFHNLFAKIDTSNINKIKYVGITNGRCWQCI